jgi:hypothetical protein
LSFYTIVSFTYSQPEVEWTKVFPNLYRSFVIHITNDNGFIISGTINFLTDSSKACIIKMDSRGNIQWERIIGKKGFAYLGDYVDKTKDDGFIIPITANSISNGKVSTVLTKLNSKGIVVWEKIFDGISDVKVKETPDGGYIFFETHYVFKTDPKGNKLWETHNIGGQIIELTNDNGYILATPDYGKIDKNGNVIWKKKFPQFMPCTGICKTDDNGYVLIGLIYVDQNVNGQFIMKINDKGDVIWNRQDDYGLGIGVKQTIDGGFLMTCQSFLLLKTDLHGNKTWNIRQFRYGGYDLQLTKDGGSIVVGYKTYNSDSYFETVVIKYKSFIFNPFIRVVFPIDNDTLHVGWNKEIYWKSYKTSGFVNIYLSTNGGLTWEKIRDNVIDDGKIRDWIVPNYPSSQCKLRVADAKGNLYGENESSFTIVAPSLQVTSPAGGEVWKAGSNPILNWQSTALSKLVNIDLSTDGGTTWQEIVGDTPDDGNVRDWIVPNSPSTQCKIKITDISGSPLAVSNGYFTILTPTIQVTSPKGGESWKAGSNPVLKWQSTALSKYVNIDLSTDGGTSWQQIVGNTSDDGMVRDWIVPNFPSTQCKIRITDISGSPSAVSNGYFTISNSLGKSVTQLSTEELPKEFALNQNFPNPFNPETRINYQIPVGTRQGVFVQLKVYDIVGREITTLVNEELSPGIYQVSFDASKLPSGVYIYRLSAGSFTSIKKMILTK